MVAHGGIGVGDCNFVAVGVCRESGADCEQFEVHHIVDDHDVLPALGFPVPRTGTTDILVEARGEGIGGVDEHVAVSLIAGQPIGIAETAVDHKSHIVAAGVVLFRRDSDGHILGCGLEGLVG